MSLLRPLIKNNNNNFFTKVVIDVSDDNATLPFKQAIFLEEEDLNLFLVGYRFHRYRFYIYCLLCILTCGGFYLLGRWIPKLWLLLVGDACELGKAELIAVKDQCDEISIEHVVKKYYGDTISSAFSPDQFDEVDTTRLSTYSSDEILHYIHYFDYRHIRFIYHPKLEKFLQNSYWKDPSWVSTKLLKNGITRDTHNAREIIFGSNLIDIQEKSVYKLLLDEVLNPFYIFQAFSMLLWFCDQYYYYATWRHVSSENLVPGDVFEISDPKLYVFPCDAVLLSGDCIVNESMLTGESIPVSKLPITDAALRLLDLSSANVIPEVAKHFLFAGTKIVRVRKQKIGVNSSGSDSNFMIDDESAALAMVVRTGFNTTKGSLIRSILFPKPNSFKFYRDSFKFIGILSAIASIGFIISTINFIRMRVKVSLIILRALDLITVVVPPALPTTMSIGTSFAIQRLKKSGIFCISPPRVNMGGKLNVMCFDKTGTLTEDGLDVLGIRYVDYSSNRFSELYTNIETLCPKSDNDSLVNMKNVFPNSKIEPILFAMTTCHSLKLVNNELIGDPLDLKMFQFTKWILEESGQGSSTANSLGVTNGSSPNSPITGGIVPTVVRPPGGRQFDLTDILGNEERNSESKANQLFELGIIRTFEFVSSLRRMSVLVKRLRSSTIEVYVKGAPEVMREICVPDSFPTDYNELLNYYTHHGFRVIACAYKSFTDLSWMKAQKIKREQVEQGLQFLGLIIFENKLKPGTAPVINTLKKANMRQIMCTGDNVLTAISVSRECGLINPDGKIYVPRFSQGTSSDPQTTIIWESLKDVNDLLDSDTLKPCLSNNNLNAPPVGLCDYTLAVTGDVFRWIVDNCDELILYRMLVKGHVFARMSPDEKHELVEKLQEMGYSVGFCGDGANDIGALKGADVGISLSEAEASVAAPFTSRKMEIDCVIEVIKEGRAALVTSFSCFKFMTLYSIIQFTTVMGQTGPYHNIHPKRPTANLVSKSVLTPLLGQIFIQSGFQFFVFLLVRRQPWYRPPKYDPDDEKIKCYESTVLFLISCFQYILMAIVFSVGPPYRKPITSNEETNSELEKTCGK
nr:13919_t:CDS:10 [Entrophospora candida]